MPEHKKIKDIIRQQERLETQAQELKKKAAALEQKKQELHRRRWLAALRTLKGKSVRLIADFGDAKRHPLNGRIGILRRIHPNDTCEVDFADLGIHSLSPTDILGSDKDEWHRAFNGE